MSSLQQYFQNAMSVDNTESSEQLDYAAQEAAMKEMKDEAFNQAISMIPFSLAEVYHAGSKLYQAGKRIKDVYERPGGIASKIEELTTGGGGEPFDFAGFASKLVGKSADEVAKIAAPYAEKYGLDVPSLVNAAKGEGGVGAAVEELKGQLKTKGEAVIQKATGEASSGLEQFTGAVKGKLEGIQSTISELQGKSQDYLQNLHQRYNQTLNSYSPADVANLSEESRGNLKTLQDLIVRSEITPEGVAKLKQGTEFLTKNIELENKLAKVGKAKESLLAQKSQAEEAIAKKTEQLTGQHEVKLNAANDRINALQTQKEKSLNIVEEAQGRLRQQAKEIYETKPVYEEATRYRSGGSVKIADQVKQSQSAIDEALIAKHQSLAANLDEQIGRVSAGKEQLVSQFQNEVERQTAPIKEAMTRIQPAIESAQAEAEAFGSQLSSFGGRLVNLGGEGLGIAGGITSIIQGAKGELNTAGDKLQAGVNIGFGTKSGVNLGKEGVSKIQQLSTETTEAENAVEKVVPKVAETGLEGAAPELAATGGALAAEGEAAVAASALPGIGEVADIGLGIAAGVTALVDIFGGKHEQAPPPPPSQVVQFQHAQGVY